jgi:hypothetical protein
MASNTETLVKLEIRVRNVRIGMCDVEGHYYDCGEDCECICGLLMNGNDHSECPVELRPFLEHKEAISEEPLPEGVVEIMFPAERQHTARPHCECGCSDIDFTKIVGWCLHCDHVYANYTAEIENRHFANDCPGASETVKQAARARLGKRRM